MRSWQIIAGLVIGLAGITVPAGLYAQQTSGPTLTVQDYVEIQQLYHRYHWVVDARDGEAWANLFTPDGEFHAGMTKTVGRENLATLPLESLGTATPTTALHFVANVRIEPSPEGARGGAYLLNVVPGEAGKPAAITAVVVRTSWWKRPRGGGSGSGRSTRMADCHRRKSHSRRPTEAHTTGRFQL